MGTQAVHTLRTDRVRFLFLDDSIIQIYNPYGVMIIYQKAVSGFSVSSFISIFAFIKVNRNDSSIRGL